MRTVTTDLDATFTISLSDSEKWVKFQISRSDVLVNVLLSHDDVTRLIEALRETSASTRP
jgi:hypothetical protein